MAWQVYAEDKDGNVHEERWTNSMEVVSEVMDKLENDPKVIRCWCEKA